ncbi:unnamed protein product [Symbiodinium natans]|uniref:Uncharacterized protein n=1 Tax=Symbiodinium natans TaxID=878477 RepID=A0A812RK12_9DINO|nr:unnamed protein product [Symbiodinium natans]
MAEAEEVKDSLVDEKEGDKAVAPKAKVAKAKAKAKGKAKAKAKAKVPPIGARCME